MTDDLLHVDSSEDTGWKMLAMCGCAAAAVTFIIACVDAYTGWRGEHFERVLGTLAILAFGTLTALSLGIAALVRNGRDRPTRRWALLSVTLAIASPAVFVLVLFLST